MKEVSELYEDMLAVFSEKTGFSMEDTADLAVRLYAAAAEIQTLYVYADWALNQSFPQTATGEHLEYHGQLRGVSRKAGTAAAGILRFAIDAAAETAIPIAAGTVCTTEGLVRFVTTTDGAIAAGELYADIPAVAEQTGVAGNVAAESITQMTKAPAGVAEVQNPAAFAGGCDQEDDESLRARILDSYVRLPNGANAAYYELRALQHEGAAAVRVIPRYQGVGTVGVVVATANGEPDAALVAEIQADLDAAREIAVDVTVMAPTVETVQLAVTIWPKDNVLFTDAKLAVQTALAGYFSGELLGLPLYHSALGRMIDGTGVVKNYHILAPVADLPGDSTVLYRLGSLTVTEGEA